MSREPEGPGAVTLRGQRIEPAAIEGALRACMGVRDAAVVVRNGEDGLPRALVAYAELHPGVSGLLPRHLMSMLAQRLPREMMPAATFIVDALPRLAGSGVDRLRLAETDADRAARMQHRHRDPTVAGVTEAFEQVLGLAGATAEDNLLSLGGDSLQALDVAFELEARFGVEIPRQLFDPERTIEEWAQWIALHRARRPFPTEAG